MKAKIKFPKIKKINKKALKRKADKLFADIVKVEGKCKLKGLDKVTCTDSIQCMHIIGRANHNLRWDTLNGLAGCSGHHMYYTQHPWEWTELIKAKFPERYEYLNEHRNEIWDGDIENVLELLKIQANYLDLI
jgi:hypothetical protein